MSPVENHAMVPSQSQPGGGTIALSTLIEYIIQRTYHELTVLSELLPRKTDMERKIEIVQFASRSRQLFVRLLALVKWANSASKVDKCGQISSYLDQQAMLFVETADMLARMARETLVQARLPSFSLPCAVDVLITGTYPRLPSCIKERIVPPDPIQPHEKRQTLMRLNQIIEHRLVTSDLPPLMRKLRIENGRVKFNVEHEFAVTLTLMGDGGNIPWRLLDIQILVEDPETGDGKSLVHSLQVNYIHQLIQSRLTDSDKPLHDIYNCLHSFCQSLQLEVLHSQAQRLLHQRLGDCIRIEEYNAGQSLLLSYWRDSSRRDGRLFPTTSYRLSIHVDSSEPSRPLQVSHVPQIHGSQSIKVAQAIRSEHLSLEKLLMHTIQVRSTAKLKDLERELRCFIPGPCEIRELPSVLYVPVLYPSMAFEKLCIAVDIQRGTFLVSLGEKETDLTDEIEDCLNNEHKELPKLLTKLRLWLGLRRCERSVQHIAAHCLEQLPFVEFSGHALEKLSANKLYIRLPKQTTYYLVLEVHETEEKSLRYSHYLLKVAPAPYEMASGSTLEDCPEAYLKPGHMVQLDAFICTHGAGAKLHAPNEEDPNPMSRKRKMLLGDAAGPVSKKQKVSAYFVSELTHVLAVCEDRIPFLMLGEELQKRGIAHQGIQVDGDSAGMALTLVGMPTCPDLDKKSVAALGNDLLACKFRIQRKGSRIWLVESIFTNCPIQSSNPRESGNVHRVYFQYDLSGLETMDKTIQNLLDDWSGLAHLYAAVLDFAACYKQSSSLQSGIEVKTFTYKRLTLSYGQNKTYTVTVQYKTADSQFHLSFGTCGQICMANCHTLMATQLQRQLNQGHSIAQLAQVLLDTWAPLTAVGKLYLGPLLGITTRTNQQIPVAAFTILPQSPTHIRIIFRNMYCIDIHFHAGGLVAVRDGAYSMFDTSKVVEGLNPIPLFKAFLNLYVDDSVMPSHARRRSATEDDNPPSPVGMDTMDSFLTRTTGVGSPASRQRQQDGLKFHSPMTPPSNPHTPASPASRLSQSGTVVPSPSAALIGTPSPGSMLAHGSPGNLHVPSPGSFVPAPSPSSLGIHMPSPATSSFISPQGMVEGGGSPFPSTSLTMPSPGSRQWPGSPSPASRHAAAHSPGTGHSALHSPQTTQGSVMSPPSRILPQKSWAASMPTMLSHDALNKILTPGPLPSVNNTSTIPCCPLERFLGCVFLRRHIMRLIQSEESLTSIPNTESTVILFKAETIQFKVTLNAHLQSLHMKASPIPESSNQWDPEELQILERMFEIKVVSAPYKACALTAFGRLLGAPVRILKDCVQIMKLELMPDRNMKWAVQWCFTMPIGAPPIAIPGTPAFIIKGKILFMLQFTRQGIPVAPGSEPQSLIVPILYDMNSNKTQLAEHRTPGSAPPPANAAINNMLKHFYDYNQEPNRCSIFPAVRELLANLVIPIS